MGHEPTRQGSVPAGPVKRGEPSAEAVQGRATAGRTGVLVPSGVRHKRLSYLKLKVLRNTAYGPPTGAAASPSGRPQKPSAGSAITVCEPALKVSARLLT